MSECSGVATMCLPRVARTSAVGKQLRDIELKIFNEDADGGGEVCFDFILDFTLFLQGRTFSSCCFAVYLVSKHTKEKMTRNLTNT